MPLRSAREQLAARLAQTRRSGRRPRRASARTTPGGAASSTVSIGATAPPTRAARKSAGSSIAPKCSPTKSTVRPGANASTTISGVSMSQAARPRRPGGAPASARPRGSSGRCAGTRNGRGVRARAGPWRRPGPTGCPGPRPPARGRPAGGCAAPARLAAARAGTRGRRRARPARISGPRAGDRRATRPPINERARRLPPSPSRGDPALGPGVSHRGRRVRLDPRPIGSRVRPPGLHQRAPGARGRRASASVAGQIGLKLYHCSGARRSVCASASAIAWVARWSSAGSADATSMASPQATSNRSSGCGGGCPPAGCANRSSRRGSPGPPAASSRRRTGGPGSRRCGSPSRPAGPASRGGAGRRRSPAGCARR